MSVDAGMLMQITADFLPIPQDGHNSDLDHLAVGSLQQPFNFYDSAFQTDSTAAGRLCVWSTIACDVIRVLHTNPAKGPRQTKTSALAVSACKSRRAAPPAGFAPPKHRKVYSIFRIPLSNRDCSIQHPCRKVQLRANGAAARSY